MFLKSLTELKDCHYTILTSPGNNYIVGKKEGLMNIYEYMFYKNI